MALGSSKPTASLTKQRLPLPSSSSVGPTSPMVSFSPSSSLHSPCSISHPWKKLFPSNIIKAGPICDDTTLAKQFNHEDLCLDMEDAAYASWMKGYPSALTMFEEMMSATKGKKIAVFLDYDGTLSPIVDDPEQAKMSEEMRSIVRDVARYFPTAIISGRSKDKVYDFVQLAELYYAGSHGMDIMAPPRASNGSKNGYMKTRDKKDDENVFFQPAKDFLPMIDEVYKLLLDNIKRIPGARVENNKFCVSVHFRCVEEKNWSALAEKVRNVLQAYPHLHLTQGKKVLEIRPSIKWHKGDALEFILESLGLASSSDVFPLYIGDDRTDEDAFKVLKTRGQGFSILVSSVPKETDASYSLRDPSEVLDFLHHLVKWKKQSLSSRSKV